MADSFGTSPAGSLSEEHKTVRALTQLLKQEQEQLVQANIEGVAALTAPKAQAAARMAELASWRYTTLAPAGFAQIQPGLPAWTESAAASATAGKSWQELMALAEVAKELNRVNGTLIGQQMMRNQNALNILQFGSLQGNTVYGPNGQTSHTAFGRHIVAR
jgi:flagella synthesis protein FlgN